MKRKQSFFCTILAILSGSTIWAGPPVPFLDDNEPGINHLFSGDPNTTEEGCVQNGPRAGSGGEAGKMHNELLECDNWDFSPSEWGYAAFLQGAFVLGESPYSDDGGWECSGNQGPGKVNPCINSTVRGRATFKNTPPPGSGTAGAQPMDEAKDWVFSFDFRIEIPAGDTFGNDKFFEISSNRDVLKVRGANNIGPGLYSSFLPDGTPDRYVLVHGTGVELEETLTLIDVPLTEGKMTVHYKASNQRLDLWHNDTLLVADFQSIVANYLARAFQLGGGGGSFENALYDNAILGVVAESSDPMPGDANGDGVVDVADLGILGANFGMTDIAFSDGDFNGDNFVDVADLGILGANWTTTQGLSLSSALKSAGLSTLVPEPATVGFLAFGLVYLGRRRRK